MRTAHRKNSRSRRRSAPDTTTGATKTMNQPFCKCGSRLSAAIGRGTDAPPTFRRVAGSPFRHCISLLVSVLLIAMAGTSFAQDEEQEEASNAKPEAGGIVIQPSSGKIAEGDTITITFPLSMVPADLINVGDQPNPFVSEPKLEGTFLWKSQTEGVFTVSSVVAEARHRLTL